MRYLLAVSLLLSTAAIADEQYVIDHLCAPDGIVFFVGMKSPGVLKFKVPFDLCGRGT